MRLSLAAVDISFPGRPLFEGFSRAWVGPGLFGIVGPSGCGKSTLLALVSGLLKPHAGEILFDDLPQRPATSWIVQSTPLLGRRTVRDNIRLGPVMHGHRREDADDRTNSAMRALGIGGLKDELAYRLSGGEKQRIAVARAIATEAPVVLADEPTASLDATNRDGVMDALRVAASRGALVLVATHDQAVAMRCDSVIVLTDLS